MREIKFRALDLVDKKMVQLEFPPKVAWFEEGFEFEFELMQFTGLKDKNGKEIYEGDIVSECSIGQEVWDGKGKITKQPIGVVEYQYAGFNISQIKTGEVDFGDGTESEIHLSEYDGVFLWGDSGELEVIGNIYENPELLKP